jgi:hypothetical protein
MKHYEITFEGWLRYGSGCLFDLMGELKKMREEKDVDVFLKEVVMINQKWNEQNIILTVFRGDSEGTKLDCVVDYLTNTSQKHYEKYGDLTPSQLIQNVKVVELDKDRSVLNEITYLQPQYDEDDLLWEVEKEIIDTQKHYEKYGDYPFSFNTKCKC